MWVQRVGHDSVTKHTHTLSLAAELVFEYVPYGMGPAWVFFQRHFVQNFKMSTEGVIAGNRD